VIDQVLGKGRIASPAETTGGHDFAVFQGVGDARGLVFGLVAHLALVIGRLSVASHLGHIDFVAEAVDRLLLSLRLCLRPSERSPAVLCAAAP